MECFEVLNPKMFSKKVARHPLDLPDDLVGCIAEISQQWTVPFGELAVYREGKPLITHETKPVVKCPARLADEGFRIAP
jgi:hypothetical protein